MNYLNLKPMHDIVVVKPNPVPNISATGIQLAIHDNNLPDRGVVVSVGPGRVIDGVLWPTTLNPGDEILYVKGSGSEVKLEDDIEPVILLTEANVVARLTK